jgi:tetratricopeptide (TPR) repeat protein
VNPVCPECGSQLLVIGDKHGGSVKKIAAASAAVLVLASGGWFWPTPWLVQPVQAQTPEPPPPAPTPVSPAPAPAPPESTLQKIEAKQRFQQGISFVSTGRVDEAIQEFSAAIELDPNYAPAYGNRGVAYAKQKKYNKAREDLTKATTLDPNDRIALYNLAVVHTLQKDLDLALDALDKALSKGFDNYDALRKDRDLTELRKHPEFRKILERHKIFL